MKLSCIALLSMLLMASCAKKIKQQEDEIYSRHLQAHVKLTIISTPMPKDKSGLNLLLLNDGQDISSMRVKEIIDSLYHKKAIEPFVVVGITPPQRMADYGVSGIADYQGNGAKADKYADFIINELYPFAKKKAGVRKFNSVVIAGCSLGGLSAFDIAWDNADKIDKVAVFSGSFWWRDKDANTAAYNDSTDRILLQKVKSSRKKPNLRYWLYAGAKEETADRDKDGIIDVIDDTKDLIQILENKKNIPASNITYTEDANGQHDYTSWSHHFADFLVWAFRK